MSTKDTDERVNVAAGQTGKGGPWRRRCGPRLERRRCGWSNKQGESQRTGDAAIRALLNMN